MCGSAPGLKAEFLRSQSPALVLVTSDIPPYAQSAFVARAKRRWSGVYPRDLKSSGKVAICLFANGGFEPSKWRHEGQPRVKFCRSQPIFAGPERLNQAQHRRKYRRSPEVWRKAVALLRYRRRLFEPFSASVMRASKAQRFRGSQRKPVCWLPRQNWQNDLERAAVLRTYVLRDLAHKAPD